MKLLRSIPVFIFNFLLSFAAHAASRDTVDITSFGLKPNEGTDAVPAVQAALAEIRATGAKRLVFAPGRYDFWPDRASEKYYSVANNDPGLKRIAFPLDHIENLEIDGGGAQFVFHGFVNPFVLDHAKNITLKNFSIDWARTFNSEARILAVQPETVDLEFSDAYPYKIERGVLVFIDHEKKPNIYPSGALLEYDAVKRETAYQAWDFYNAPTYLADPIAPGQVRLKLKKFDGKPGNILVFADGGRRCPAFTVSDSENTKLDHVTIYHAGGMGLIAQRSRDLTFDHVSVTLPADSKRMISASADATHFANCSGEIRMTDCVFENQEDDATNVHGIYAQVTAQTSPTEVEVRMVHPQQFGFDFLTPGQLVEWVHGKSLITHGEGTVRSVTRVNAEYSRVTMSEPIPKDVGLGDVVASLGDYPDVTIRNCVVRRNRARGFLLGSRGKIVIEGNTFHTPGAAILFEGDGEFWFEQAGVRDCLIQNNTFDNCNYGVWGTAAIQVGSGIASAERAKSRYNRNIRIENNTFRVFDPRILHCYSVDGLVFRNNQIVPSTAYPANHTEAPAFDITFSDHVTIEEAPSPKRGDTKASVRHEVLPLSSESAVTSGN